MSNSILAIASLEVASLEETKKLLYSSSGAWSEITDDSQIYNANYAWNLHKTLCIAEKFTEYGIAKMALFINIAQDKGFFETERPDLAATASFLSRFFQPTQMTGGYFWQKVATPAPKPSVRRKTKKQTTQGVSHDYCF